RRPSTCTSSASGRRWSRILPSRAASSRFADSATASKAERGSQFLRELHTTKPHDRSVRGASSCAARGGEAGWGAGSVSGFLFGGLGLGGLRLVVIAATVQLGGLRLRLVGALTG